MAAKAMIAGNSHRYGMVSIFTHSPISGRFSSTRNRLPIQNETIKPQKSSGSSLMTFGPGTMPWMSSAPIRSAMIELPGRPSVRSGMKDVWAAALFADSGPATPSMAPLPNSWGFFAERFSTE